MKKIFLTVVFSFLVLPTCAASKNSLFKQISFRNFTYPGIWHKRKLTLRDGKLEYETQYCTTEINFDDVEYRDLTGDDKEEAIITLRDWTACGSSGISYLTYIYGIRNGKPYLLWKFGTGSESTAGLKSYHLIKRQLVYELFGRYRIVGARAERIDTGELIPSDCCPLYFSRIHIAWDGKEFKQQKLKVMKFPYASIQDYYKTIDNKR